MTVEEIEKLDIPVIKKNIDELIPYANNSKEHSDSQVDLIAASIERRGFINPVIIRNKTILAGHGRILAAKKIGLHVVPCMDVSHLSELEAQAFVIADNKLTELGKWNKDMLSINLKELKAADYDLALTGFSNKELAMLTTDIQETQDDDFDINKALDAQAFAKLGDIYILGNHRLMCGDSTKSDDFEKLINGNKMNLCITDPLYNCNYKGGTGMKIKNDNFKDSTEFFNFLLDVFKNIYGVLVDGGAFYAFHSDAEKVNFFNATVGAGFHYSTTCIWVKDSLVLGRMDYQMRHEPVIYAFKDTGAHQWYSDRKQSTVWEFDRPKKSELHPTQKPLNLIAYPMQNSSQENGLVLDPFGGSGSTLMAAEQLNRKSFLMELDPKYVSAIVRRYVAYKKKDMEGLRVIRDGLEQDLKEIYNPESEDFTYKEANVNG